MGLGGLVGFGTVSDLEEGDLEEDLEEDFKEDDFEDFEDFEEDSREEEEENGDEWGYRGLRAVERAWRRIGEAMVVECMSCETATGNFDDDSDRGNCVSELRGLFLRCSHLPSLQTYPPVDPSIVEHEEMPRKDL